MIKNTNADHFGPIWTLLNHFGALTSLSCFAIFGPKWNIFGPLPVMNSGPQSKKRLIIRSTLCGLLLEPRNAPYWNINMATIHEKCQKQVKIP